MPGRPPVQPATRRQRHTKRTSAYSDSCGPFAIYKAPWKKENGARARNQREGREAAARVCTWRSSFRHSSVSCFRFWYSSNLMIAMQIIAFLSFSPIRRCVFLAGMKLSFEFRVVSSSHLCRQRGGFLVLSL